MAYFLKSNWNPLITGTIWYRYNMNWVYQYINKPQWCSLHLVIVTPSLVGYIFLSLSFGKAGDDICICRSQFATCSYNIFIGVQKMFIPFYDICTYSLHNEPWLENVIWDHLKYILNIYSMSLYNSGGFTIEISKWAWLFW